MASMTATLAEACANFSKIAASVNETGKPVTVFKNSKPWVAIAPVNGEYGDEVPYIDWAKLDVKQIDERFGHAVLPKDWDDPADEGVYDDLV